MRKRQPAVIDAEFFVVGQEPPKPWWRRLYLSPGWWVIALLTLLGSIGRLTAH
jgi:hypothetical protein